MECRPMEQFYNRDPNHFRIFWRICVHLSIFCEGECKRRMHNKYKEEMIEIQ